MVPLRWGELVEASRRLSARLAAISQKADLHCQSAALQVLLRLYITNNADPAYFVMGGAAFLCDLCKQPLRNELKWESPTKEHERFMVLCSHVSLYMLVLF